MDVAELTQASTSESAACCSSPCSSADIDAMFTRVIGHKEAYFRSEQIGSPDLTDDEKKKLLGEVFISKPAIFLSRYWQYLDQSDIGCFANVAEDYDVDFYLRQLAPGRRGRPGGRAKLTANRRYATLRQLVADGEYFSDEQMRQREPLLYDQMVGQYLTDSEKSRMMPTSDRRGTLIGMFSDFAETQQTALRRREEQAFEDSATRHEKLIRHAQNRSRAVNIDGDEEDEEEEEEEFSSDDDDEEEDQSEMAFPPSVSDEEKSQFRAEFISHMHERFLAGKDDEFVDYADIDSDARNDPIDLMQRDAEDNYFDSEEPNDVKEE